LPLAQKGQRFGGRKKGTPNKIPRNLIEKLQEIDGVLESQGKGLLQCAEQDPQWYFEHFCKPRIPKNVEVSGKTELTIGASDALMAKLNEIYAHK
jgi:hypothetical protein